MQNIFSIMWMLWIILVWCSTEVSTEKKELDVDAYCKLNCQKNKHTICEYRCKLGPLCIDYENRKLNDEDRIYIRDLHNYYRNNVASGNDTRGGNGEGKNIMVMNYHKDIEIVTLCWARRCTFKHDSCRNTIGLTAGGTGQNLFQLFSSGKWPQSKRVLNMSMRSWYGEIQLTNKAVIEKYHSIPEKIGHYTQMLWSTTLYFACSRVAFRKKKWYTVYVVCNYNPCGNIVGKPVYEFGSGCTEPLQPNDKYPALCGTIDKELRGVAIDYDKVTSLVCAFYVLLSSVILSLYFTQI